MGLSLITKTLLVVASVKVLLQGLPEGTRSLKQPQTSLLKFRTVYVTKANNMLPSLVIPLLSNCEFITNIKLSRDWCPRK